MDPFLPDDRKVAAIRAMLPATGAGIFLDVATAGPLPAETATALREADDWELRVGRGGPDHGADTELRREEAGGVVAAILGVTPDRVLTTSGVRAATAAVLGSLSPATRALAVAPGVEPAVAEAARGVAAARGWLVADATDVPGGVALVPAVRADDGMPVDLPAVAARVHATGGLVVADLSLAAGATDLAALPALGADAAILATDRWLLGPDGTAAAWLAPALGSPPLERAFTLADPLPRRAALGLGRSLGWLLMYVGLPWAVAQTRAAATHLRARLAAIEGVTLLGLPDEPAALSSFSIAGWEAEAAADELGKRVFAITGRAPGWIRASVGAWSTIEELDRFAGAVAELAAHTPDTLPRRQPLTILGGGHAHG
jgi:selenocysteine lyase/cysteine desulfurase